jgi:hypothetical protein
MTLNKKEFIMPHSGNCICILFLADLGHYARFCHGSYGINSSSVGELDQAGRPASAYTGLYRQKGKINPGDTGSQPKQLHIRRDI